MEKSEEELKEMKKVLLDKHQEAVTAAHVYACALPLGKERERAFEVFQSLRTATRV